jgi:hypothetical protein
MTSSRHKPVFPVPAANKAKGVTKVEYLAQQLFIHNDITPEDAFREANQFYDYYENVNQEGDSNES